MFLMGKSFEDVRKDLEEKIGGMDRGQWHE
jgi:hypothetical protein